MIISYYDQPVKANISIQANGLAIQFEEDPCYIRSETVLVDLMQRSIGVIFENAYHHIGDLPDGLEGKYGAGARLSGQNAEGKIIELHAPVKIIGAAV